LSFPPRELLAEVASKTFSGVRFVDSGTLRAGRALLAAGDATSLIARVVLPILGPCQRHIPLRR
jgi:hypothetical protein